jgi:hypothetical protein
MQSSRNFVEKGMKFFFQFFIFHIALSLFFSISKLKKWQKIAISVDLGFGIKGKEIYFK